MQCISFVIIWDPFGLHVRSLLLSFNYKFIIPFDIIILFCFLVGLLMGLAEIGLMVC